MSRGTALISVSDKTNVVRFARGLTAAGFRVLSSGGTAKALAAEGVPVETVESYTGSPEVMDGRVKTLHPRVHGGILARGEVDHADLERLGASLIDLVVVNLYPFEKTTKDPKASHEDIIENIDIGGPAMIRSAAKNHARVTVVCDPADYDDVLAELASEGAQVTPATRTRLAAKAFAHTAGYDAAICGYLSADRALPQDQRFPLHLGLTFERAYGLRYGENPHQHGAFYVERHAAAGSLASAVSLGAGGKELSFNNLVDVDAALDAVREFERPSAVVVKHTNPCGVASADTLESAYRSARDADALSAFGGIVALNREVDETTARLLAETFLEAIVAPSFSEPALAVLHAKKNLRLLATGAWLAADHQALQYKRVGGGLVVQTRDNTGPTEVRAGKVVTKRAPTAQELAGLDFAWRVCKHVKSNAIVLAHGDLTVGVGAGQMSRVVSVQIACEKAGDKAKGSVLASDAFFPFPDGIEAAARAGILAVAQPGGSVKDPEVIAAADALGLAMIFTGARHFRH
jgi:phosphoribosylaminoimidazolecarboxamide formyltransferase / IMP cyclohydrolase